MQFEKQKKPAVALDLLGLAYELETVDGTSRVLRITAPTGEVVRIEGQDYHGLCFALPAKPKMVERWRVHGVIGKLNIDQLFEDQYAAERAASDAELSCERVEVPEP